MTSGAPSSSLQLTSDDPGVVVALLGFCGGLLGLEG
jgi:hypothetical protein